MDGDVGFSVSGRAGSFFSLFSPSLFSLSLSYFISLLSPFLLFFFSLFNFNFNPSPSKRHFFLIF
jgi:hypothetical protein